MGHETRKVTGNALVADDTTLVYADTFLNPQDIDAAIELASKEGVKDVYVIEQMPDQSSHEIWVLIHRHNLGLRSMTRIFDAVSHQIRKGGPINPKQVC